jgi:hypothetical protein
MVGEELSPWHRLSLSIQRLNYLLAVAQKRRDESQDAGALLRPGSRGYTHSQVVNSSKVCFG